MSGQSAKQPDMKRATACMFNMTRNDWSKALGNREFTCLAPFLGTQDRANAAEARSNPHSHHQQHLQRAAAVGILLHASGL